MKILHVVGSFYPATGFGGPIWSTKLVCDYILKNNDKFELKVISFNFKEPNKKLYLDLNNDIVKVTQGKYNLTWIDASKFFFILTFIKVLIKELGSSKIVHLTGIFSFHCFFTILFARVFRKYIVISARGSLQALSEFEDVNHKFLKKIYLFFVKVVLNNKTSFWLGTTENEVKINNSFIKLKSFICTNAVEEPLIDRNFNLIEDSKTVVSFISRLSPKKGLPRFLEVCSQLDNSKFDIYIAGIGDKYLENLVLSYTKKNSNFTYFGEVKGNDKSIFYNKTDILYLPSHSENFGIVIAEALAHGASIFTTVNEPWSAYNNVVSCFNLKQSLEEDIKQLNYISEKRKLNYSETVRNAKNIIHNHFSIRVHDNQIGRLYNYLLKDNNK